MFKWNLINGKKYITFLSQFNFDLIMVMNDDNNNTLDFDNNTIVFLA